jgi:CHAT domain-containing protein
MFPELLQVLGADGLPAINRNDLSLQRQIWISIASIRLHRYHEAEQNIALASQSCVDANSSICGELFNARGSLEVERGNYQQATPFFLKSLSIAHSQKDRFLEAWALLNLTQVDLLEEHFDEAIDRAERTYEVAKDIEAQRIMVTARGNLGWASYKTGDPEAALKLFLEAQERAKAIGSLVDEIRWLTTSGYVYLDQLDYRVAEENYRQALDLARKVDSKEQISDAITSLAVVTARVGEYDAASVYSDEAIAMARANNNRVDELYPLFTKGQVAAQRGDLEQGEKIFSEIVADPKVDPSLKWEVQHSLANLFVSQNQSKRAENFYRESLVTLEKARASLTHETTVLPFLSNASSLYEDYVRFLLSQGKTTEALSVADHARARTLAEGLGQLSKNDAVLPARLKAQTTAQRAGGPILYYLLGARQSYLWAITAQKTSVYQLPPKAEIEATVHRYRKALEKPRDLTDNPDGLALYQTLVAPALPALAKASRVFIIPDGTLNALNFEALLVPDPKPHYWIEDITVTNASSLRLLDHSRPANQVAKGKLLLIGNPTAASTEFGTLPQAALEMDNIGKRFAATDQRVLAQSDATPAAYLAGKPGQFAYIHFVAHGTASRLSPLDSAIVLSKPSSTDDSFRLYARDIIHSPLRADLVTISSCYGAGSRAYSGEGLVGLSWAFLRAGAHNVIGALWDVSDASTPRLMDEMYAAIQKGKPPAEALRQAKLSLLHSTDSFRRPYYWAPFQFYTGS